MARLGREYEDESTPWGDYIIYSDEGRALRRFPDNEFGRSQAEAYYHEIQHLDNQQKIIAQNQAIIDANKRPSYSFPPPRSRQELDPEYREWLQFKKETDPKFRMWKIQKEQKELEAKLHQAEREREERLKCEKEVQEQIKHERRRRQAEEHKRALAIEAERQREDEIIQKIKTCTSKSMFKAVLPLCNTSRLRDEWYKRTVNNRYMSRSYAIKLLEEAYPAASISQQNNNPTENNYTFGDRNNNRKKNSPLSVIIRLIIMVSGLLGIYFSVR